MAKYQPHGWRVIDVTPLGAVCERDAGEGDGGAGAGADIHAEHPGDQPGRAERLGELPGHRRTGYPGSLLRTGVFLGSLLQWSKIAR